MKIKITDEDTRVVSYDDGFAVELMWTWMRNGGWGWIKAGEVGTTDQSVRRAADRLHRLWRKAKTQPIDEDPDIAF